MDSPSAIGRLVAETDRCVACGLCVPQCPSYQVTRSELDSPRGRVHVMRALLEGSLAPGPDSVAPLDRCLGCGRCEAVCPALVRFQHIVDGTRAELSMPNRNRAARLLAWIAARPSLVSALGWALPLLRARPVRGPLGGALARMGLPPVPPVRRLGNAWGRHPAKGASGEEVHLFVGCFARVFDGPAIRDAVRLINACGHDVVVPRGQGCCGSLSGQLGQAKARERLQERNRAVFGDARHIVLTATGCARAFAGKATDVCSFVAEHGRSLVFDSGREQSVLVHEPCSARNHIRERPPVEELLRRVPGLRVFRLRNSRECCGAAGGYHVHSPGIAGELRATLLDDIARQAGEAVPAPSVLLTANYGCGMFIRAGLEERGIGMDVRHPVSFLSGRLRAGT